MIKLSNLLLALILFTGSEAQTVLSNKVVQKEWRSFIPKGYDTLVTEKGDLNKDAVDDLVLVLKHEDEEKENIITDSVPPRLLLVLFKQQNGYVLRGSSEEVIMCKECGGVFGDPFQGIGITNGVLIVSHYGGSAWKWAFTNKFRFQKNGFFLIGKFSINFYSNERCEKLDEFAGTDLEDINYVTGQYERIKVSEEGCKLLMKKKGKQKVQPLLKLEDFKQIE